MSLTRDIASNGLFRQWIDRYVDYDQVSTFCSIHSAMLRRSSVRLSPDSDPGLVGSAIQYAVRLSIFDPEYCLDKFTVIKNKMLLSELISTFQAQLDPGQYNLRLALLSICLAGLEREYREGVLPDWIRANERSLKFLVSNDISPAILPEKILNSVFDVWTLMNSVKSFASSYLTSHDSIGRVEFNPTFEGSGLVGGADANLIIDQTIFDIRATQKVVFTPENLYQQLGYLLLDFSDSYQLNSIHWFFVRQNVEFSFDIKTLLDAFFHASIIDCRSSLKDWLTSNYQDLYDGIVSDRDQLLQRVNRNHYLDFPY